MNIEERLNRIEEVLGIPPTNVVRGIRGMSNNVSYTKEALAAREEEKPKEPEFEEGDWVVVEADSLLDYADKRKWLIRYSRTKSPSVGFFIGASGGLWSDTYQPYHDTYSCRKATPKEIEEALVREAERRYEGVKRVKRPSNLISLSNQIGDFIDCSTRYEPYSDKLEYKGVQVYYKGEWAEVVEEKKPKTLSQESCSCDSNKVRTLLGYEVIKDKLEPYGEIDIYKIGCKEFTKSEVDTFIEVAERAGIEYFSVNNHQDITLKELKEALS